MSMKMDKLVIPLACAVGLIIPSGCVTRNADLTVISTKNVNIAKNLDLDGLPRTKGVEGKSSQLTFLFIPFEGRPNIKDAVDDALAKADGDLMLDPVFY